MRTLLVSALFLLVAAGCVTTTTQLVPASGASVVPGREAVTVATVADVRFTVATNVWRGTPSDLPRVLTPVRVTIENGSQRSIRIRYQEFALVGQSGFLYAAIPPLATQGAQVGQAPAGEPEAPVSQAPTGEEPAGTPVLSPTTESQPYVPPAEMVIHPRVTIRGFQVAPWYRPYYPGIGVWPGYFPYDPFYYDYYYRWWREPLPTRDMIEEALPEGVLESGGMVSGFVYFNDVEREGAVDFRAEVVDAESGEKLGTVNIPFVVR